MKNQNKTLTFPDLANHKMGSNGCWYEQPLRSDAVQGDGVTI